MMGKRMYTHWLSLMGLCLSLIALMCSEPVQAATKVCSFPNDVDPTQKNTLAAKVACEEHALWQQPYINGMGHLIHLGPMEAERDALTDGTAAWRRVERYWTLGAGIEGLYRITDVPEEATAATIQAIVRSRIVDIPWSGTFMTYVMKQAGMTAEEFAFEDGHIRYIKPAFSSLDSAYAFHAENPLKTKIAQGDLLCYARDSERTFGAAVFFEWLSAHAHDAVSLKMHCDIVVAVQNHKAYAVGGNVAQAVTMRQLTLSRQGFLSKQHVLPATVSMQSAERINSIDQEASSCAPLSSNERHCDMNKKDWVVLLKYKNKPILDRK